MTKLGMAQSTVESQLWEPYCVEKHHHFEKTKEAWASSTLFLSVEMTPAGSLDPKTALPATTQLAPASAACLIVEGPKPPSTCKRPKTDEHTPKIFLYSTGDNNYCIAIYDAGSMYCCFYICIPLQK